MREQSRYAVNLVRLDRFLQRHRRNDGSDAFRQHRFARARRPDHENVVATSNGYFQRPLDVRLPFYIGKIDLIALMGRKKFSRSPRVGWSVHSPERNENVSRKLRTP